jgi:uncharacterized delta-60 repeat protein
VIWGKRGRRNGSRLALLSIAVACAVAAIGAVATAEDPTEAATFGQDGIASQSLGTHFEETRFSRVEARADGGLVAQRDDRVEAYLADGAPDPAAPPQRVSSERRVFPVAGGKSLVLDGVRLTRVNGDGSVDPGFGDGGKVKVTWDAMAAAELPSGKVLVVGVGSGGTHEVMVWITVEMLNPDGSHDRGFGEGGSLKLSLPSFSEAPRALEIAPTGDGGALVSGGRFLLELRADGSPNPSFGGNGLIDGLPPLVGARVLPDGTVAAVGWDSGPDDRDLLVLRYTATGAPVPGFGQDGIRTFDLGGDEDAHVASWAADGSVIVGGSSRSASCFEAPGCEGAPVLVAFDPGGGLDPGFGIGGVLRLAPLAGPSESLEGGGVDALTRRPDDSIVAAGSAPPKRTIAFLVAVSSRGELLPGFGEGGIVRVRRPVPATQRVTGFAPLADGKLLAAGSTDVGAEEAAVLIRYAADGSLDRSFGGGAGYVAIDEDRWPRGLEVDDSGRVLTSIYAYPYSRLLELRAADGAPESSFGADGVVSLPKRVFVEALDFAAGGGVAVAGTRNLSGDFDPGVVLRFGPDGQPARGFGRNGRVELLTPGGRRVKAKALAAGTGGRVLVAGFVGCRLAVVRLLPNGRPDPRFGSRGWVLRNGGGTVRSVASRRAGSRLYLAAVVQDGERYRVALLRFKANGRPDPTFGRAGRRTTSIPEAAEPKAILPSPGGVLVVLSKGPRPLLSFGRKGKVRRQPVPRPQQYVSNVRATVSQGRLILGWNAFSRAIRRDVYHLASRPLGRR